MNQITVEHLFALKENMGWKTLKDIWLQNFKGIQNKEKTILGFRKICLYEFTNL